MTKYHLPFKIFSPISDRYKNETIMFTKHKGSYFCVKIVGESAILWRASRFCDGDCMLCPDGTKRYKKRIPLAETTQIFEAEFWVVWNNIKCRADLSTNKKYVRLYLDNKQDDLAIANKFKWDYKTNQWRLTVPLQACTKYFLMKKNVYPGLKKDKLKKLSMKYWIEMYEKLNFDVRGRLQ